jgi:hypothetical protein
VKTAQHMQLYHIALNRARIAVFTNCFRARFLFFGLGKP